MIAMPVSREWLRNLHGKHVTVRVDLFGVMCDVMGWAIVDDEALGVNTDPEVGHRAPRQDDPDDIISFDLAECSAAIDERGWLIFHTDGWKVGWIGVRLQTIGGPSDGAMRYGPPALAWEPEAAGPVVSIRDYANEHMGAT